MDFALQEAINTDIGLLQEGYNNALDSDWAEDFED